MSIRELSEGIRSGRYTCTQLAEEVLRMIAAEDQDGRKLNTTAEIDPELLFRARAIDEEIRKYGPRSPLHGIPILLKDNIDVKNMHTTAGSYALHDLIAKEDAFLTKKLRDAGALIVGKSNLSEFAYFMSRHDMPSGYSSNNGQVGHAWVPGRDPSGSSSGSAVAVSARFVPCAIGTETDGSLMSPAINNAIMALKPTVGLVSRNGILPISTVQDTAGPMCTCTEDIALVLEAIAGKDDADPATYTCLPGPYLGALDAGLRGLKIGLFDNDASEEEKGLIDRAEAILLDAGAQVKRVRIETVRLSETEALKHEFKQGLNLYLSAHDSACRSLSDIITFNNAHPERCLRYGQDLLESSDLLSGRLNEPDYITLRAQLRTEAERNLCGTLREYDVDCLLTATDRTRLNLAPVSGCPCLSMPAVKVTEAEFHPVSYYMMAGAYGEEVLLRTARALEEALGITNIPEWVKDMRSPF